MAVPVGWTAAVMEEHTVMGQVGAILFKGCIEGTRGLCKNFGRRKDHDGRGQESRESVAAIMNEAEHKASSLPACTVSLKYLGRCIELLMVSSVPICAFISRISLG